MSEAAWRKKVGKTIKRIRVGKGLTLQQASDRYGNSSMRWWQRIENGRFSKVDVLYKAAKALGVPAWKLLK